MSTNAESTDKPMATKDKILAEITERLKSAQEAQEAVVQARKRAEEATDPDQKAIELEEAMKQEKKAKSEMKIIQRLQSGTWQGGASGAGIGAGVGLGLGTVVGSVVGGVVAIPTTSLGLLVGAGTGAIHGPWVKLPDLSGKDDLTEQAYAEDEKSQNKE